MAKDKDVLVEEIINESDKAQFESEVNIRSDKYNLDARRKLEDYMEMKKLRELTDY